MHLNAIGAKRDANNKMSVYAQSNLVKVLDFNSSYMAKGDRERERERTSK